MPPLDPHDLAARSNHYISNHSDWWKSNRSSVPPRIKSQLLRFASAEVGGKRPPLFSLPSDHPSLNFYAFMSARYEVAVREWNVRDAGSLLTPGTLLERRQDAGVDARHTELLHRTVWPVSHRQARIIEFPRIASFAQAFPAPCPTRKGLASSPICATRKISTWFFMSWPTRVGHQWWAHQVVGANMQGATVLSETLAQYTALMVMERQYGRDMMRKFLRYEMDRYLRSRGNELLRERH